MSTSSDLVWLLFSSARYLVTLVTPADIRLKTVNIRSVKLSIKLGNVPLIKKKFTSNRRSFFYSSVHTLVPFTGPQTAANTARRRNNAAAFPGNIFMLVLGYADKL